MMSRSIRAEITIQAEPHRVWEILTGLKSIPCGTPLLFGRKVCRMLENALHSQ